MIHEQEVHMPGDESCIGQTNDHESKHKEQKKGERKQAIDEDVLTASQSILYQSNSHPGPEIEIELIEASIASLYART